MITELLSQKTWRSWTVSSLLSRFPLSMSLVAFALAAEHTGLEAGDGTVIAGATTLTAALLGPWAGRRFDGQELRRRLQRNCLLAAAAVVAFALLVNTKAPLWGLIAAAIVLGLPIAGMLAGFRALLFVAVERQHLRHAHFVESFMVEFSYGVGPVLVTVLILFADLNVVLGVMAASFIISAAALRKVPAMPPVLDLDPANVVRTREFWSLCALGFCIAAGVGLIEGSVALRMSSLGVETSHAGAYLLLLGIGSCIGGVAVSLRPLNPASPVRVISILLFVFALTIIPFVLVDHAVWFALILPFVSMPLVPLNGLAASLVEARLGAENRGVSFGFFITFMTAGGGLGVIAAGVVGNNVSSIAPPALAAGLFACIGLGCLVASVSGRGRQAGDPQVQVEVDSHKVSGGA